MAKKPVPKKKKVAKRVTATPVTLAGAIKDALIALQPPPAAFNPNSIDTQFAVLHTSIQLQNSSRNERMDAQDKVLREIKVQTAETNGRVTVLETKWKTAVGWIAGASATAIFVVQLALHFWK